MIQNAPSIIIGINLQGNITSFNRAAERITGYSKDEVMGKNFVTTLVPDDELEEAMESFKQLKESGPGENVERHLLTKSGDERLIAWCIGIMDNDQSKPIGRLLMGNDITEKELMLEEIVRHNRELESLNSVAFSLIQPLDLVTSLQNALIRAMELIGGGVGIIYLLDEKNEELVMKASCGINPESNTKQNRVNLNQGIFKKVMESGSPVLVDDFSAPSGQENSGLEKEGFSSTAFFPLAATRGVLGVLMVGTRGAAKLTPGDIKIFTNMANHMGFVVENAGLFHAQDSDESEWENVFNSITEPMVIISSDNKILRINSAYASLINSEPDALIGKSCCDVLHEVNGSEKECPHSRIKESGEPVSHEVEDEESGTKNVFSGYPLYNEFHEIVGSIIVVRTVPIEIKAKPEESQGKNFSNLDSLISAIAHEINNPLGGILGNAETIMREEDPLKVRVYSKEILDGATRVSKILETLAPYTEDPSAQGKMIVDLNEIIHTSLKTMSLNEKFGNVYIDLDLAPVPKIEGNPGEIQQVFTNLLKNSLEAMKGSGRIRILTRRENGSVQAIISDEGEEIPKERLAWMFDHSQKPPFDPSGNGPKGTESELRLHTVSTILRKHNAPISIENLQGKGRSFKISFPHGGNT